MQLFFWPQGFPRSTTRSEWRDIWRWKRITTKELAAANAKRIELLRTATMPDYIRRDFLDHIVNPPLVIHDKQRISTSS